MILGYFVSLPLQTIEELISESYVSAIIAKSGFSPHPINKDFGIDLEVRNIAKHQKKRIDIGAFLSLQLKASTYWKINEEFITYDMDVNAYNKLIFQNNNACLPCALVLCCLPKDKDKWVEADEEELSIKKCCYYLTWEGYSKSNNKFKKRIKIPRKQLFTPESLQELKKSNF